MITVTCADCGVKQEVPIADYDDGFIICFDCYASNGHLLSRWDLV